MTSDYCPVILDYGSSIEGFLDFVKTSILLRSNFHLTRTIRRNLTDLIHIALIRQRLLCEFKKLLCDVKKLIIFFYGYYSSLVILLAFHFRAVRWRDTCRDQETCDILNNNCFCIFTTVLYQNNGSIYFTAVLDQRKSGSISL